MKLNLRSSTASATELTFSGKTSSGAKSTNTGDTEATTNKSFYAGRSSSVVWGRAVFVTFLLAVAGILGGLAYYFLAESEQHLVEEQFFSMTARALEATHSLTTNKLVHGTMVMAKLASYAAPDASAWPFIWIDGYFDIVASVIPTSAYTGVHLVPIVSPEQASDFEDFAYSKFGEAFGVNTTAGAQSHFGEGIWVQDETINTTDNRFHDTTGISIHGSPIQMIAPKFQHAYGDKSSYVMMNVHGFKTQGEALDATINCTKFQRPTDPTKTCQALSAMHPPMYNSPTFGPKGVFAFMSTPIFPKNDPDTLVGFIFAAIWWVEVMEEVFPSDTEGIDCVLKATFANEESVHSYSIQEGSGVYLGEGDMHQTKWDDYKMSKLLMEPGGMADDSATYTLTCYPNDSFPSNYTTKNPIGAAIGAVLIILITSLIFFLYDKCVKKEFNAKKDLLEAKRQFVRFVSHEVRTPLNSVCMGLALMKEEMAQTMGFKNAEEMQLKAPNDQSDERATFNLANEVLVNAQCSVDVLNDLLNYDKVESGTLSLELTVVSIWTLIERTVTEFKLPMASKNIKLQLDIPSDSPFEELELEDQKMIGDNVRITQVLRNLVSNAIKFTPEGGGIHIEAKWRPSFLRSKERTFDVSKPRDKVTCSSTGDLVLTVKDTGAGMTKEQLKKLFGQGVQFNVNELQHGNGSGLGLFIAMGIVEQHEGTLVCDSEGLGKGTSFIMTIPVYNLPTLIKKNRGGVVDSTGAESFEEDPKLRILVVDDAALNRKLLGRLLKTKGHENDQAEDGLVGVEMVKKAEEDGNPYDMVLLDYEMPRMNGPEAARAMRANGSDVFIAGVTGNLLPEDMNYFRKCGANAILPKPFRITDFDNLIFEYNIVAGSSHDETTAHETTFHDDTIFGDLNMDLDDPEDPEASGTHSHTLTSDC